MYNKCMKDLSIFKLLGIALLFISIVSLADFNPPTELPPGGNIAPPIHAGKDPQVKRGPIGIQRHQNCFFLILLL
jgi:hypothetical protein